MIVECVSRVPTAEQVERLGKHYTPGRQEFPLEIGQKYLVYGLRCWDQGVWIDVASEAGYLVLVPLCLFKIVDGRLSALWEARTDSAGGIELLPTTFHRDYFIDDLVEGDTETLKEFWRIRSLLIDEIPVDGRADPDLHI